MCFFYVLAAKIPALPVEKHELNANVDNALWRPSERLFDATLKEKQ